MKKHVAWIAIAAGFTGLALGAVAVPAAAAPVEPTSRYVVRTTSVAATSAVAADVRQDGGDVEGVYGAVLPGLSATLTADQAAELVAHDAVVSVTRDEVVRASSVQTSAPWDLDRLDQRAATANSTYRYDTTGRGVTAYVIDSGVRLDHSQFGGRAVSGYDFVDGDTVATDCEGHGTHVAGTVAGSTYGVAKAVQVVSVRVLDCEGAGYASDIIDALDWVVAHKDSRPAVANLSLGGRAFPLLDEAVERTVAAGVTVVVAAGNEGVDACSQSPARAPHALTVAATTSTDAKPTWSNFGSCVDLFAPGAGIRSAGVASTTATAVMNGTSMATPHVVGAVARYLQTHPTATPAQATSTLTGSATTQVVQNRTGSPDRLLYLAPPATAPGRPTRVAVRVDNTAKADTLSWAPPTTNGGSVVTGYRVTRSGKDARGRGPVTVTLPATARAHTFKNLRTGTSYTLTVRALNAVGAGAAVTRTAAALR